MVNLLHGGPFDHQVILVAALTLDALGVLIGHGEGRGADGRVRGRQGSADLVGGDHTEGVV